MPLTVSFPNFIPGTTIFSSQTNTNNADIEAWANAHEVAVTGVHGVGSGQVVGTALTQNLTNKTFLDNIRWLAGTAQAGILTHVNTATRTYTFPDANGTVVLSPSIGLTIDTSQIISGTLPVLRGGTGTTTSTGAGSVVLNSAPTLTGLLTYGTITGGAANVSFLTAGGVDASGGTVAADTFIAAGEILLGNINPPTANRGNRNSFAKAHGYISSAGAILYSYNVTSSSRSSAGVYLVNFTTPFSSTTNISFVATSRFGYVCDYTVLSTTQIRVQTHISTTGAVADSDFSFIAFGGQ